MAALSGQLTIKFNSIKFNSLGLLYSSHQETTYNGLVKYNECRHERYP